MDDISEKLKLLDYENSFCKEFERPTLSRIYFSHPGDEEEKFRTFYDMAYWLMMLSGKKAKRKIIKEDLEGYGSRKEACR